MSGELWLFGCFINTVLEVYFLPLLPYNPMSALALYYVCSGHRVLHYISPKKDVSWHRPPHTMIKEVGGRRQQRKQVQSSNPGN